MARRYDNSEEILSGDNLDLKKLDNILRFMASRFKIVYLDFSQSEFAPYWERKIKGLVRLDEGTVYIHSELSRRERELTWLHEALSIYYYYKKLLRHDEEIEKETERIYQQAKVRSLLRKYVN